MVLVKNWQLIHSFFFPIGQGKCFSRYVRKRNYLYRQEKQEVEKVKNLTFFQGGIIHGLRQKLTSFPSFYFRQNRVKICVSIYFRKKKNAFLGYKNKKFKTSKN